MPLQEVGWQDDKLLQELANRLAKSHKIIVISGAGISTSCGIPDFRSKDGLYNIIPEQLPTPASSVPSTPSKSHRSTDNYFPSSQPSASSASSRRSSSSPMPKLRGQDLFDASVWKRPHTTEMFYKFIASLRQKIRNEVRETSLTHKFIRTLRDGGRLMRCYTQNVDGLERREGLSMDLAHGKGTKKRFVKKIWEAPRPSEPRHSDADGGCEVVPLHGDLEVLRCTLCQKTSPWIEEATAAFLNGSAPECAKCADKSNDRQERGKRGVAVGSLRPNIVLYGEEHPLDESLAPLIPFDLSSGPEILIIMGTSLKVHGLQKVVREFAKKIHARKDGKGKVIFVNRTKPAESMWENVIDSYVAMDCDDWVKDLRARREDLWLRQGELDLTITKPGSKKRKAIDGPSTPSKRAKVLVEIPKASTAITTPQKNEAIQERDNLTLITPPSSCGAVKIQPELQAPTPEPFTPRHSTNISFKPALFGHVLRFGCLSPLRPDPSPLRNSWKPSVRKDTAGTTPARPQVFSPIEERRSMKLSIYQDPDAEDHGDAGYEREGEDAGTTDLYDEEQQEQADDPDVPETPSKTKSRVKSNSRNDTNKISRVLRPRTISSLNLGSVAEKGSSLNANWKRPCQPGAENALIRTTLQKRGQRRHQRHRQTD